MRKHTIPIVLIIALQCYSVLSNGQSEEATPDFDSLRIELEQMLDADQKIRKILIDSIGLDSPEAGKYLNQMASIDNLNRIKISAILEKYGWIEKSKIGQKASEAIFYLVQHSDLEFLEKYFPQFKKRVAEGEANPALCAMMEDRLLMWKGKKQIYGSQANNSLRPDKKYAIWPIENPSTVNALRKKVGFSTTVEENAKRLNAEYNPAEELPAKQE